MTTGEKIRLCRIQHGWSMREMAKRLGYANSSSIARIESGQIDIPQSKIAKFAKVFGCSAADLMEKDDARENAELSEFRRYGIEKPQLKQIPLLGTIACGSPIFAEQNIEEHIPCPCGTDVDFCLRAKGDSMVNARIHDGDIVFIRQQDTVEDGEIAAVLVEDEATIKRVYFDRESDVLALVPENPAFKVMRYMGADIGKIQILGKAVLAQHILK